MRSLRVALWFVGVWSVLHAQDSTRSARRPIWDVAVSLLVVAPKGSTESAVESARKQILSILGSAGLRAVEESWWPTDAPQPRQPARFVVLGVATAFADSLRLDLRLSVPPSGFVLREVTFCGRIPQLPTFADSAGHLLAAVIDSSTRASH